MQTILQVTSTPRPTANAEELHRRTWEDTLLIPPPDLVPMWGQMAESGDCCGFIVPKRTEQSWRVACMEAFNSFKDTRWSGRRVTCVALSVPEYMTRHLRGRALSRPPLPTVSPGVDLWAHDITYGWCASCWLFLEQVQRRWNVNGSGPCQLPTCVTSLIFFLCDNFDS